MTNRDKGFILILSAPSGAGKSTLANHLVQTVPDVRLSVSTTTRAPRPGEVPGEAYHFIDQPTFRDRIARGDFLEWAEVFGNCYGTARENVDQVLHAGEILLLDIDWQGARQVRASWPPEESVSVSIFPPSHDALYQRLRGRASDDETVIARRMAKASAEISHWEEYDYLLVNDDLSRAQRDLIAIVTAERMRRQRSENRIRCILSTFAEPPFQTPG